MKRRKKFHALGALLVNKYLVNILTHIVTDIVTLNCLEAADQLRTLPGMVLHHSVSVESKKNHEKRRREIGFAIL